MLEIDKYFHTDMDQSCAAYLNGTRASTPNKNRTYIPRLGNLLPSTLVSFGDVGVVMWLLVSTSAQWDIRLAVG